MLLIAVPALTLQRHQVDELNAWWNNVFRKIFFGYRRSESVKDVISGLGRVNFTYVLLLRIVLNSVNVCTLNRAYCMTYLVIFDFLTVMTAWGLFLFHCIKLSVICCASYTTMCFVMLKCIPLLWPPCVADADIIFLSCFFIMAALWNRQAIIFLPCGYYLFIFFPRLISAAGDWMSTILPHMVWP